MVSFKHRLGEGKIKDGPDGVELCFYGVWSSVMFRVSNDSDQSLLETVKYLAEEPLLGKIELYLLSELQNLSELYIANKLGFEEDSDRTLYTLLASSPRLETSGRSSWRGASRIIENRSNGFGMDLESTGYLNIYGSVGGKFMVGGIAHVADNGELVIDHLTATTRTGGAPAEPEDISRLKVAISHKWKSFAKDNRETLLQAIELRHQLLNDMDDWWSRNVDRISETIVRERSKLTLTHMELCRKISALDLKIDPENLMAQTNSSEEDFTIEKFEGNSQIENSTENEVAIIAVGLTEAIARNQSPYGDEGIVAWRRRMGEQGGQAIVSMALQLHRKISDFTDIKVDQLDDGYYAECLDCFDFGESTATPILLETDRLERLLERYSNREKPIRIPRL